MADFFPSRDADVGPFVTNLENLAAANPADYGVTAADVAPVTAGLADWNTKYPAHVAEQAAAASVQQAKDASLATLIAAVRTLVRKMQGSGMVSAAEAAALGLGVRDTEPTPAAAPTTRPLGRVDNSERLRQTIHVVDSATPTSKAKPDGVRGCEIWEKIGGPPPTDPSELSFVTLDSKTPHTNYFDGEDAGKMAHYMMRWVSTRGEPGPWSETVSATITG